MDVTERFTGRAEAYAKARPDYPTALLGLLSLRAEDEAADLGSGTGIFSRLLLRSGAKVHAVEPNADMRKAAEGALGGEPNFHSVNGTAEATTLADASIDLVTAAQAFHWFDLPRTGAEMRRILKPNGRVALVWNDRSLDVDPFHRAFEAMLCRFEAYKKLQGKADRVEDFDALFGEKKWSRQRIAHEQVLDEDGLVDRVRSTSYAPSDESFFEELRQLFRRHAPNGKISMQYQTVIISGQLP